MLKKEKDIKPGQRSVQVSKDSLPWRLKKKDQFESNPGIYKAYQRLYYYRYPRLFIPYFLVMLIFIAGLVIAIVFNSIIIFIICILIISGLIVLNIAGILPKMKKGTKEDTDD